MSQDFHRFLRSVSSLEGEVSRFIRQFEQLESTTSRSSLKGEERYQYSVLYQVYDKLSEISFLLGKMSQEVKVEGLLEKLENGRYAVQGIELSSGTYLEYFDGEEECFYPSRLEHNGQDYYIVALGKNRSIEGVLVRLK